MNHPRKRIIAAAGRIFGRKGFKAATVREICKSAGVNLAAVNYYFGDKVGLYRTVVVELMENALQRYPADMGIDADAAPQERIKAFIQAILHRLLAPGGLASSKAHGQLLARELADPSPVLDTVVQGYIGPQAALLAESISQVLGPQAKRGQVMRCVLSIISQCFYYGYAWPIIVRLHPMDLADPDTLNDLAEHIGTFSLGGLRELKQHPV